MKKILLSALAVSSAVLMNAQSVEPIVIDRMTDFAVYDDFMDGNEFVDGNDEYSAIDSTDADNFNFGWENNAEATTTAYKGLFWTEATGETNGFYAARERNEGVLEYTLTQNQGFYEPFLIVFGSYSDNGSEGKYTVDLTDNANVSFDFTNSGDSTIRLQVQLQDVNGSSLVYRQEVGTPGTADENAFYNQQIGFIQGSSSAIGAGENVSFSYDFANAIEGCADNVVANADDSDACEEDFDYTQVTAVTFTVVNDNNTGATLYQPYTLSDYPVELSEFKMGADPVAVFAKTETASFTTFPNPSTDVVNFSKEVTNVTVLDANGTVVMIENSAKSLDLTSLESGIYLVKSDQGSTKIVVE